MLKFDSSYEFSWDNARAAVERCIWSYGGKTDLPDSLWRVFESKDTNTAALVVDEGSFLSVTFRGSKNILDWIQNFKVHKEHVRKGMYVADQYEREAEVHLGFSENVESVISKGLVKYLDTINKPVIVCGHSKGAAEGTYFALELVRKDISVLSVYPVESPRLFNVAGRCLYNGVEIRNTNKTLGDITYRINNQNDVVTRLPLWVSGYRHVGQNEFLTSPTGWIENPSLLRVLSSDMCGFYAAWQKKGDVLIKDHLIEHVQQRIQNLH